MAKRRRPRYSQHFLEPAWVNRVVACIGPSPDDRFLEIGAGRGALTQALATSGAAVTAVEIDRQLIPDLERTLPSTVTVIHADFLTLELASLWPAETPPVRVVGNLPYQVGAPILLKVLKTSAHGQRFRDAFLMLQREVADRVTARPGSRDWGPLGVAVSLCADASRVLALPPGAFRPIPQVRSAVVALRFRPAPIDVPDLAMLDRVVRCLFTHRRKTAANALRSLVSQVSTYSSEEVFRRAHVEPRRRPAELELAELAELSAVLAESKG